MAADVSKNAADVENYSKEFLELQDQLAQMKREKFNGVELFAVENEQDNMKGINKSHLVVNGELHANVNGKTYANKAEYEYFDDPMVDRRTKSTFDKYEFQLYTHPTGVADDGNIKLNIVNLQFMLGLKNLVYSVLTKTWTPMGIMPYPMQNGQPLVLIGMEMAQ